MDTYTTLKLEHLPIIADKGYQWLVFGNALPPGVFEHDHSYHTDFIFIEVTPVSKLPELKQDWYALPVVGDTTTVAIQHDVYWYCIKESFVSI